MRTVTTHSPAAPSHAGTEHSAGASRAARRDMAAMHGASACACGGGCPRCASAREEPDETGEPLRSPIAGRIASAASANLDDVRVHTGPASQRAAEALGANAFTVGRDIHFGAGQFRPDTRGGGRLIAHEIAHALQPEDSSGAHAPARVSTSGEPAEIEADAAASAWIAGRSFVPSARRDAAIFRDDKDAQKQKTFLTEGFTGRETEDEARLIAASKGWVVEGAMRWNGRNWIGEKVRKGTGSERAVAQVRLDLQNVSQYTAPSAAASTSRAPSRKGPTFTSRARSRVTHPSSARATLIQEKARPRASHPKAIPKGVKKAARKKRKARRDRTLAPVPTSSIRLPRCHPSCSTPAACPS